jgi:hypothetical protein
MSQVELLTSESGGTVGGKWDPYMGAAGLGETTAARLSALLHGQIVVKFEVETWRGEAEAIISLSSGAKLHIRARSGDICQLDYRVVAKRYAPR